MLCIQYIVSLFKCVCACDSSFHSYLLFVARLPTYTYWLLQHIIAFYLFFLWIINHIKLNQYPQTGRALDHQVCCSLRKKILFCICSTQPTPNTNLLFLYPSRSLLLLARRFCAWNWILFQAECGRTVAGQTCACVAIPRHAQLGITSAN